MRRHLRNSALIGLLVAVALLARSTPALADHGMGLVHGILEDYRQGGFNQGHTQGLIQGYCQGVSGSPWAYGGLDVGYYPWGPAGPAYGGCAQRIYAEYPVQNPGMSDRGRFHGSALGHIMGGGLR